MKKLFVAILFIFTSFTACTQSNVKSVAPEEFKKLLEEKGVQVIDVRTPEEFNAGIIKNAININFYDADFEQQIQGLDKEKLVLVYCAAGGRSSKAATMFMKSGYKNVTNLEGGYTAWKKKGFE